MRLHNFIFSRLGTLIFAFVLFLGLVGWTPPSETFAQGAPAAQDAGSAATSPSSPIQPKPTVELPDGDGKAIATEYCQDCHKLTNVVKARKAPDDWHDTVQTMMDRGARLPQDKFDILVQYLAKNFGPETAAPAGGTPHGAVSPSDTAAAATAQAPKPVELPEGDGKAIATEFCQDCHKLTNVTKARKALDDWRDTVQTMMDRLRRVRLLKLSSFVP